MGWFMENYYERLRSVFQWVIGERLSFGLMVGVEGFLECSILRFFVIEISHNA